MRCVPAIPFEVPELVVVTPTDTDVHIEHEPLYVLPPNLIPFKVYRALTSAYGYNIAKNCRHCR